MKQNSYVSAALLVITLAGLWGCAITPEQKIEAAYKDGDVEKLVIMGQEFLAEGNPKLAMKACNYALELKPTKLSAVSCKLEASAKVVKENLEDLKNDFEDASTNATE